MELQQFEQAILKLAFETDARITTASVAYYLGVPSREANRLLNALLEEGVLELDSDSEGNLYYRVPNQPSQSSDSIEGLKSLLDGEGTPDAKPQANTPPPESSQPPRASKVFFNATTEQSDDVEPFSPVVSSAQKPTEDDGERPHPGAYGKVWGSTRKKDNWGGFDDYYDPNGADGDQGTSAPRPSAEKASGTVSRPRPKFTTISTTRSASPDASVDRCGSSPYVVRTETRCEPKPLPEERPMIVSCSETPARAENGNEQLWFGRSNESTAMVPAGDTAIARDYYIEQPEHQPGMALLLSLILCGTGQIYNGEVSKGIMMMVLCFLLWFVLLGWVVHIWSIVDAVVVAERLNRKAG